MRAKILTLGCKVNQYESESMLSDLAEAGFAIVKDDEPSDITVINSCAVTGVSEQKTGKLINRARRENKDGIIVLTGCVAQAIPNVREKYKDVDIVLGNKHKKKLVSVINEYLSKHSKIYSVDDFFMGDKYELLNIHGVHDRTRAFLKIEDGCNRFCTYCIIPYARGRVRSRSLENIKDEVTLLSASGYKEIVLVGINLSSYGSDIGKSLCDAVDTVCEVDGIERVRLGSLEPEMMELPVLKSLASQPKFCPQFHLSLQSGCDETLKRMNRHYTSDEYLQIVDNIREIFDNPSITTDIMVGFPGETEEEFKESVDFAGRVAFAKAHIFPYSRRPGTIADRAPNQLTNAVKKERCKKMSEVTDKTRDAFLKSQVGLVEEVLLETRTKDGYLQGYTKNYTPIYVKCDTNMTNKTINVKLTDVFSDGCIAEIV